LGSARVKAARKHFDEIDPWLAPRASLLMKIFFGKQRRVKNLT